jgi:uncharacterized protein (DUF2141 family)
MIAQAVTVTANYKDITYPVTISGGSTNKPNAKPGETVTITANTPPSGKMFNKWTTPSNITFADDASPITTFTMISNWVSITATFKDIPPPTYSVTIINGSGSDNYEAGATVHIIANDPPEGQEFDKWTTANAISLNDATAISTTFTMISQAVTVTATYKNLPPPTYSVTVINGSGSDYYEAGATVRIIANAPQEGKTFDQWTTEDDISFENANASTTSFTMISQAVTVTATYKNIPPPTYNITILDDGNGSASAGVASAEAGALIYLTSIPDENYIFKEWSIIQGDIEIENDTFIMPAEDVIIKAIFQEWNSIIATEMPVLQIYPNPTRGELQITNYELRDVAITIFDAIGRVVFQKELKSLKTLMPLMPTLDLDISHLPNGIYYLKIGKEVKKVVKMN